jgi:hypothetical protein
MGLRWYPHDIEVWFAQDSPLGRKPDSNPRFRSRVSAAIGLSPQNLIGHAARLDGVCSTSTPSHK